MESVSGTNINSIERTTIKYIIMYIKNNELCKALTLMSDYVEYENIIKAVHDYLLGINCRYPYIKFNNSIKDSGIYNIFISRLDFEMYNDSTISSNCPCGSLVCTNWKYFTRPSNDVWTIAPMEFFTNEYFQQGFMENFKFCSHNNPRF